MPNTVIDGATYSLHGPDVDHPSWFIATRVDDDDLRVFCVQSNRVAKPVVLNMTPRHRVNDKDRYSINDFIERACAAVANGQPVNNCALHIVGYLATRLIRPLDILTALNQTPSSETFANATKAQLIAEFDVTDDLYSSALHQTYVRIMAHLIAEAARRLATQ